MSDPREQIKSVIQDLIADRRDSADATMHDILVARTRQVAGLAAAVSHQPDDETPPAGDENA